jgi:hypothetical protein
MLGSKRISDLVESPPTLTENTPEKSIKNFSNQYLGAGMWPSKNNHGRNDRSKLG